MLGVSHPLPTPHLRRDGSRLEVSAGVLTACCFLFSRHWMGHLGLAEPESG